MSSLKNFTEISFVVNIIFTSWETCQPPSYEQCISHKPTGRLDDYTVRIKEQTYHG